MGIPPGVCSCLEHRPARPGEAQGSWLGDEAPEAGSSFLLLWMGRGGGLESSPGGSPLLWSNAGKPARRGNSRESSLNRVPEGPWHVSLPGVPQNSFSGQRPPPPLSQVSPPPPGGRGPGTSPHALVSLPFLCPLKSRCIVIKKGGAAAHSSPAGAEGMLTPQRAQGAGPPPLGSPLPCWTGGRRGGSGRAQAPAQQSISKGRTRMSPS